MENIINRQFAYNEKYYQPAHMGVSRRRTLSNSVLLFGRQGLDEAPLSEPACFILLSLIVRCAYSLVCGMLIKFMLLAWAWLAKAKGHSCHTKNSTLAKTFTEKNE